MKKQKKNNKGPLIFIGIFTAVIVVALLIKVFYVPMKTYHSKFLKITIDYPAKYELEERFGTITFKSNNGNIILGVNGTNYTSIDDYLNNLSELNHFKITNKDILQFKFSQSTVAIIDNKDKVYYFYPDKWAVYFVSASSPSLYSDLDRIARSFRYEQ